MAIKPALALTHKELAELEDVLKGPVRTGAVLLAKVRALQEVNISGMGFDLAPEVLERLKSKADCDQRSHAEVVREKVQQAVYAFLGSN